MISRRAREIFPFLVMDVLEKTQAMDRRGQDVIHLEVGEPDFDTPDCIKEAAHQALRAGHTHYTHSLGLPELREAICRHYGRAYGVAVHPDQVVVTSGTSPAMLLAFALLLEAGGEVVISDPHYACYPNFIRFFEGEPVCVSVSAGDGFQFSPESISAARSSRTRAVLINSPSNPTGNLLGPDRMEAIAALGLPILSDEVYHGLVYREPAHSILEYTDNAFVINGFSKAYAMTGWRLGYLVAPQACIRSLQKMQQNLFISANAFVQWAGVAALEQAGPDVARMRAIYDERRRYVLARLRDMGLGLPVEPTGAFYALADIRSFSGDSYRTAFDILEKTGVGVAPGIDFGRHGEGYLRISYANSLERLREGLDRIQAYVREQGRT